jgi:hypothetical protein
MVIETSNPPTASSLRPWYRLRWTTVLALITTSAALVYSQSVERSAHTLSDLDGNTILSLDGRGWPIPIDYFPIGKPYSMKRALMAVLIGEPDRWPWLPNIACSLLLLFSTVWVCERRMRGNLSLWQFNMRSLFAITAVCSIMTAIYTNEIRLCKYYEGIGLKESFTLFHCGLSEACWYANIPMLFGIACVVFASGSVAYWGGKQFARRIISNPATNKLGD